MSIPEMLATRWEGHSHVGETWKAWMETAEGIFGEMSIVSEATGGAEDLEPAASKTKTQHRALANIVRSNRLQISQQHRR